jgi:hypothetical protein
MIRRSLRSDDSARSSARDHFDDICIEEARA